MISIENGFRGSQILLDFCALAPWKANQHIEVIAHHSGFSRHRRHQLEFLEFRFGLAQSSLGHPGLFDFFLKLFNVSAILSFTQLLLNSLYLLIEVKITLAFLHLTLHPPTDTLVHIENFNFLLEFGKKHFQASVHTGLVKNLLFVVQFQRQMGRNGVGKPARILDVGNRLEDFRGNFLVELDILLE